jgi:hypothetical protein
VKRQSDVITVQLEIPMYLSHLLIAYYSALRFEHMGQVFGEEPTHKALPDALLFIGDQLRMCIAEGTAGFEELPWNERDRAFVDEFIRICDSYHGGRFGHRFRQEPKMKP